MAFRSRGTEADGQSWGLVEIYGGDRVFAEHELESATAIVDRVGELLAVLERRV